MEQTLKNGGLLPSAIALRDSLSQRPDISQDPTMLTQYQIDLLLQGEKEIDDSLADSPRLDALLKRLGRRENPPEDLSLPKRQ